MSVVDYLIAYMLGLVLFLAWAFISVAVVLSGLFSISLKTLAISF